MNVTDVYNKNDTDHIIYLRQESLKIGKFNDLEINELSTAMHYHGLRLLELMRAMRNYVQNPFGKYFILRGDLDGIRKADSADFGLRIT